MTDQATASSREAAAAGRHAALADAFERDGVVLVRDALDEAEMALLERSYEDHFNARKAIAERMYGDDKDEIYFLTENTIKAEERYQRLMRETRIADIARDLFRGHDVYYFLEQMWKKTGGARRTAWHQDTAYLPMQGTGLVIFWIPLDPLDAANVLEVIPGSHRSTLWNAPKYDPTDFTAPLYDEQFLPRIPDIESERAKWTIFSTAMKRGDVLAFHPGCLHGGAPTLPGQTRRSYTFRFFSDDAFYAPLPPKKGYDSEDPFARQRQETEDRTSLAGFACLKPGDPLSRSPEWPRIRPWAELR